MNTSIFERKLPRRIAGYIVGMLFAVGAAWAVASALGLEVARSYILLVCLITLAALCACFYNKITALVSVLAVVLAAVGFFVWGEGLSFFTEGAGRERIDALISLITTGAGDEASNRLAARLIAYAASFIAFCTAARLAGGITLGVGSLALFIAVWYSGYHEIFGCFALCAAATAAVAAAGFGRRRAKVSGADENARCGSPAGLAILAIPVVLVLAIACTFFRPLNLAPNFQVRAVERTLDDLADIVASRYPGFSRRTVSFSLNSVGYGAAADLGGPVTPSDGETLRVYAQAGKISLLRGSVRANYTGDGWTEGELAGSYRFSSSLWEVEKADSFDLLRSADLSNASFAQAFEQTTVRIVQYSHFTSMFTLDRPTQVSINAEIPYFNMQGEIFPKAALKSGDGYQVSGWAFKGMTRSARRGLSRLVARSDGEERTEFLDALYADYLPGGAVDLYELAGLEQPTPPASVAASVEGETAQSLELQKPNYASSVSSTDIANVGTTRDENAQRYYLFYGYTAEQLAEIERLDERIASGRLKRADADYPQPQELWLSEARLASYRLDEALGDYRTYNSASRAQTRIAIFYDYRSVVPQSRVLDSVSQSRLGSLAADNNFTRIEFAGYEVYYPGYARARTVQLTLDYLLSLDEGEEPNPFDLALTFAEYLSEYYTYTLEPTTVPDGVDFVDWFFSTGEGYCTYYATAMAQMARYAGIPSRYAEGYSLSDAEEVAPGEYLLTGENAHAWAELFFEGVGFVPFDPLSLERYNSIDLSDETYDDLERDDPTPSLEPEQDEPVEPDESVETPSLRWLWILVALVAVAALVAAACALYLRSRTLEHLRKKHGDRGAARELWREILLLLPALDKAAERRADETSLEYAHRVRTLVFFDMPAVAPSVDVPTPRESAGGAQSRREVGEANFLAGEARVDSRAFERAAAGSSFERVADAGMRAWYADETPTEQDLALLDACASSLRRRGLRRGKIAKRK